MLKLQYFGHLMQRTDSLEKTLILGKIEGRKISKDRVELNKTPINFIQQQSAHSSQVHMEVSPS